MLANPKIKLTYIVDGDEERCRMVKNSLPLDKITFLKPEDTGKVFLDQNVDGVIIATPTHTHTQLIKDSLKAGKAVFAEKPISEHVEDTIECYNVADLMNLPLLCAFNRRFDPTFKNVFRRIREGSFS